MNFTTENSLASMCSVAYKTSLWWQNIDIVQISFSKFLKPFLTNLKIRHYNYLNFQQQTTNIQVLNVNNGFAISVASAF